MFPFNKFLLFTLVLGQLAFTGYRYSKTVFAVEGFVQTEVRYSTCFTRPYSRGSYYIVIANESEEYCLFPYEDLVPENSSMEDLYQRLEQSRQAMIWYDYNDDRKRIMGIKTEFLSIPPQAGLAFHRGERWAMLCLNLLFIGLAGILFWVDRAKPDHVIFKSLATILQRLGWKPDFVDNSRNKTSKS